MSGCQFRIARIGESRPESDSDRTGTRRAFRLLIGFHRRSSADQTLRPIDSRTARVSLTMIVRDEEENLPHCPGVGAGHLRRDRRGRYRQHGPDPGDRPGVRGPGVRLRLDRRLRRGAERGALACDRRLRLLARCRRRGRPARAGEAAGAARRVAAERAGRLRGAMRLRPQPRRQRRRDRRRSRPALPAPRRHPLDLPRPRADHARPAPRRDSRPLDRPGRAAHRLCRPRPARPEARSRHEDPPGGAEGPAGRPVRPVQPRRDRHRAARLERGPGISPPQPGAARRRATRSRGSCSP